MASEIAGLVAIGEAEDVGQGIALGEAAGELDAVLEARREPALVAAFDRLGPDPDRDVGDHAERSLRAEHSSRSDGPAAVWGVASVASGPLGVCISIAVTSSSKRP